MVEHRKRRLAFIKRYGLDLYKEYIMHATNDSFLPYAIDFYGYGEKGNPFKRRTRTMTRCYFRNHSNYLMRHTFEKFSDRAALIAHMKAHREAFDFVPQQ